MDFYALLNRALYDEVHILTPKLRHCPKLIYPQITSFFLSLAYPQLYNNCNVPDIFVISLPEFCNVCLFHWITLLIWNLNTFDYIKNVKFLKPSMQSPHPRCRKNSFTGDWCPRNGETLTCNLWQKWIFQMSELPPSKRAANLELYLSLSQCIHAKSVNLEFVST